MTVLQQCILRYIDTQFVYGSYRTELVGESVVRLIDSKNRLMVFSANLYGDILDFTTSEVVAYSNLPHSLSELPMYAMPTAWKNNPAYFG